MRRFLVLVFLVAVAALGVWYGWRGSGRGPASSRTVTNLLPKGTMALFYVPDFKRSRAQWHETDLYKLWREPAVQDFLSKPLARSRASEDARRQMQEMDTLDVNDAFLALTTLENNRASVVGGFRFEGSEAAAEKMIGPWRQRVAETMPDAKPETINYEGRRIEMLGDGVMVAATAYAGNWFFASNTLAGLKAVLDRVDKRETDQSTTLTADEIFIAAAARMPADCAALGYARLDRYMKKLTATAPADENKDASALREIKSIAVATMFKDGKMRDAAFVVMPKLEENGDLTRQSLALATTDSFLYFASLLHWPAQLHLPDNPGAAASGMPALLRRFFAGGVKNIPPADWMAAFGQEMGVIGDWPANSRTPALIVTLPVKDAAKAAEIVQALTTASVNGSEWTRTEKNGVQHFSQPASSAMLSMAPTIALSSRLLVGGLDAGSVERAIQRGETPGDSGLAQAEAYRKAAAMVPAPQQSFTYLDTALLYQRLDTALRPMLIMAAAFMPKVAEAVDWGKLPPAEVITKHLSPLVVSQSYSGNGYLVESAGPFSIFQAATAGLLLSGDGLGLLQKQVESHATPVPTPELRPDASPEPTAEPSLTDEEAESPSPTAAATP